MLAVVHNFLSSYHLYGSGTETLDSKIIQKVDDVVLLNEKGFVCETSCANIFIVKNNKIFILNHNYFYSHFYYIFPKLYSLKFYKDETWLAYWVVVILFFYEMISTSASF